MKMTNRFWIIIIVGYLLYLTLTLHGLYIDYEINKDTLLKSFLYSVVVIAIGIVFILISNGKLRIGLLLSFVIPYGMWSSMSIDPGSGLSKAQWHEQLAIFLIVWLIAWGILQLVLLLIEFLITRRKKTIHSQTIKN